MITWSIRTKLIWDVENFFYFLYLRLHSLRVGSQMKDCDKHAGAVVAD
jgi:hypothetical protein